MKVGILAHRTLDIGVIVYAKINPLEPAGSKGKSKDIHLPSIDVNFGSNRILYVRKCSLLSLIDFFGAQGLEQISH
jgi:hypothetical protein